MRFDRESMRILDRRLERAREIQLVPYAWDQHRSQLKRIVDMYFVVRYCKVAKAFAINAEVKYFHVSAAVDY